MSAATASVDQLTIASPDSDIYMHLRVAFPPIPIGDSGVTVITTSPVIVFNPHY